MDTTTETTAAGWETTTQQYTKKQKNSQAELIHLFLNHSDLLDRWLLSDEVNGIFSEENQIVLDQLICNHESGFSLTRKGFEAHLKETYDVPKERIRYQLAYAACASSFAKPSDYPTLLKTLVESHKARQASYCLEMVKG